MKPTHYVAVALVVIAAITALNRFAKHPTFKSGVKAAVATAKALTALG